VGAMSKKIAFFICLFLLLWMHGGIGISVAIDLARMMGAIPLGMAAFTAVADDGNAVIWNPAGLSLIDRMELNFVDHRLLSTIVDANSITLAAPISRYGALGLNVNYLDYGNDISRYDENDKFLGQMKVVDTVVALSYGKEILSYGKKETCHVFGIGGNGKGIRLYRGGERSFLYRGGGISFTGWSIDVGLLYRLYYSQHNIFSIGICAQDIPKLFYEEEQPLSYPTVKTGIAANFGSLTVAADADFEIRKLSRKFLPEIFSFGLEKKYYWKGILGFLRGGLLTGFSRDDISLFGGFSIKKASFVFDCAGSGNFILGNNYILSFSYIHGEAPRISLEVSQPSIRADEQSSVTITADKEGEFIITASSPGLEERSIEVKTAMPPKSEVQELSEYTKSTSFKVAWSGADDAQSSVITATIKNTEDKVFTRTRMITFEVNDDSIGNLESKKRATVRTINGEAEIKLLSPKSGIKVYELQYKDGKYGGWTNWLKESLPGANIFGLGDKPIKVEEGHTYYFRSRACDNAGNWEEYSDVPGEGDTHTTVDTKAPVIETYANSVLSLPDNSTINNATPNISAIITDTVSGVSWKDTVMTINGPSLHNVVIRGIENETGRINYMPKEPLSDGKYVVTLKTSDKARNSPPDEKNWVFNIDTTPPTASIEVSSRTPPFVKESECKITLMPSEKLSATTLKYKLADGSENSLNLTEEKNTNTWTGTVIIYSTIPNGTASFTWKGRDIAGNEGIKITDGNTFTIDTSAPTVGNMKLTSDSFINAEVKDETSGVDERSIMMEIDGKKVNSSYNSEKGIVSYKPAQALSEGKHTVMIEASDKAGNKAEKSFSFTVDTVAPEISNVTPPDGSLLNNAVSTISAEVKDETSGVDEKSIILEVDGKRVNSSYNPESGTVSYKPDIALSEGEHKVTITAIDKLGNKAQKDRAFKIDTIQPTARIEVLPGRYPSMTVILTPSENLREGPIITNICVVKAPAFMRGDETTLNFLWLNATKN
jgi:hypothetical protein